MESKTAARMEIKGEQNRVQISTKHIIVSHDQTPQSVCLLPVTQSIQKKSRQTFFRMMT